MTNEIVTRTAVVLFSEPPSLESVYGVAASSTLDARRVEMTETLVRAELGAGTLEVSLFGSAWPDEDEESLAELGGPSAGLFPGALARAGGQDALWPGGARAADAHRAFALLQLTEPKSGPKLQMEALERAGVALLAHPGALCVFFPAGESLRDGNVIGGIRAMAKEQGALPLQIWINGRVADAGQGVRVADVVGLGQLGQMDQEAVFPDRPGLEPFEVLGYLFDVTHHLFNEGGDLEEGVVYEGPGGLRWRASLGHAAQIPPARGIVRWIPLSGSEDGGPEAGTA